jgi:hypothetical protein
MSQLYLVTITVDLGAQIEETRVAVCAQSGDAAAASACIHAQIAPSMCSVVVKRIKGNCYGFVQETRNKPKLPTIIPADRKYDGRGAASPDDARKLREAEIVQAREQARPSLKKRIIEIRASLFSRTDGAAFVGLGKAVEAYGRTGRWEHDFVTVEDIACREDEQRKPNNDRVLTNAQYADTHVYKS